MYVVLYINKYVYVQYHKLLVYVNFHCFSYIKYIFLLFLIFTFYVHIFIMYLYSNTLFIVDVKNECCQINGNNVARLLGRQA